LPISPISMTGTCHVASTGRSSWGWRGWCSKGVKTRVLILLLDRMDPTYEAWGVPVLLEYISLVHWCELRLSLLWHRLSLLLGHAGLGNRLGMICPLIEKGVRGWGWPRWRWTHARHFMYCLCWLLEAAISPMPSPIYYTYTMLHLLSFFKF